VLHLKLLLAALAAALLVSGCRPSQPDQGAFQSTAEQAVSDMVSEVATSRLMVQQTLKDRFVGKYPVVVLTYSEESAGKATDRVSTVQPPRSERHTYQVVITALQDANDAVTQARIAATDGNVPASRRAVADLTEQLRHLRRLDDRLKAAQR
jgi:hypothetical protein